MTFNRNVKKFLIENQKFGSQRHTTISDFELYNFSLTEIDSLISNNIESLIIVNFLIFVMQ